LNDK